jgi:hypothetical protein
MGQERPQNVPVHPAWIVIQLELPFSRGPSHVRDCTWVSCPSPPDFPVMIMGLLGLEHQQPHDHEGWVGARGG